MDDPERELGQAQLDLEDVAAEAAEYRSGGRDRIRSEDIFLEEWLMAYRAHEKLGKHENEEVKGLLFARDMDVIVKSAAM